jgi:hypothetical protein
MPIHGRGKAAVLTVAVGTGRRPAATVSLPAACYTEIKSCNPVVASPEDCIATSRGAKDLP